MEEYQRMLAYQAIHHYAVFSRPATYGEKWKSFPYIKGKMEKKVWTCLRKTQDKMQERKQAVIA